MVTGVDLFFVLSGFLIGSILYDARFARNYYSTFYGRRVHRIFPVCFLWLMLFLVGLHLVGPKNVTYLHRIPSPVGAEWLSATWSLAVEEQFYLLLPFDIQVLSARGILG